LAKDVHAEGRTASRGTSNIKRREDARAEKKSMVTCGVGEYPSDSAGVVDCIGERTPSGAGDIDFREGAAAQKIAMNTRTVLEVAHNIAKVADPINSGAHNRGANTIGHIDSSVRSATKQKTMICRGRLIGPGKDTANLVQVIDRKCFGFQSIWWGICVNMNVFARATEAVPSIMVSVTRCDIHWYGILLLPNIKCRQSPLRWPLPM